jgi:uncharacterized membrane protein
MKEASAPRRIEPRWLPLVGILVVVALTVILQTRVHLLPSWVPYLIAALILIPMAAVQLTRGAAIWLRVERVTTIVFVVIVTPLTVTGLANIIHQIMAHATQMSGAELLESAIFAWITNVVAFSLLYWWLDRGGPERRILEQGIRPDWRFPQQDAPPEDVPEGWGPTYIDYLFLSFSTCTAFSTTETSPMTRRAKMLMMLEAAISLVTITAVAARAINVLG